MRRFLFLICLVLFSVQAFAQVDRHDVRAGNRKFKKGDFKNAEIDYRKAVVKDSLSVAGEYNLANDLYRQQDYDGAGKALETIRQVAGSADYHFNAGDVALQKKDYAAAVEAFRNSLLQNPGDLDAKENYIYAKKMLENQQGGGGGGNNDQNQNQNQDQQNQQDQQDQQDQNDQNDQNDQQDQNDQNNQDQQQPGQEPKISPQQAQQMLKAIQAKEAETQDKVNKEKAAMMKSKQKEKNW